MSSAFGGSSQDYPPIQRGKEKRGGLILPADFAQLLTAAERAKLAALLAINSLSDPLLLSAGLLSLKRAAPMGLDGGGNLTFSITAPLKLTTGALDLAIAGPLRVVAGVLGAATPTHATLWHDESLVTAGAALAPTHDTAQNYATYSFQNAGANADTFTQTFYLDSGTYTFSALGITNASYGKIDWTLDGASIAAGQDWYTAGLTYNVIKATAGVGVNTSGVHTLQGKVNGKNAASSGFNISLTKMWFR